MQKKKGNLLILSVLVLLIFLPGVSAGNNMVKINNITSDGNGNFVLDDVPYGKYELYATNYSESRDGWQWYKGKKDVEINGSNINNLDLVIDDDSPVDEDRINSYVDGYSITGRTYSTGMGKKFNKSSDVVLLTSGTSTFVANTTSDEDGNFVFNNIPYGEYELYATNYSHGHDGWEWYKGKKDVEINGSNINNVDLIIDDDSPVDEDRINSYVDGYSIKGHTYSTGMGKKFNKSSNVVLLTSGTSTFVANTTSDENGNFVFNNIPYGEYELYATNYSESRDGWQWYKGKKDVEINGSNLNDVDLVIDDDSPVDEDRINSYVDGYSITGRTYSTGMGNQYNKSSNVLLLKSLASSSSTGPRINVSIITGYSSYRYKLDKLVDRINSNSTLNLSVSFILPSTDSEDIDLSSTDVIYINMFTESAAKIESEVNSAIDNGTIVIGDNTHLNQNVPESYSEDEDEIREYLEDYWKYSATEESNLDNLVFYLSRTFMDRDDLEVKAPKGSDSSIYHPGMTNKSYFTSNATEYFEWYRNREDGHSFDENAPTVGLIFYSSYYPADMETFDSIINEFESRNMNVVTCYGSSSEHVDSYLNHTPETKVDLILSTTYRSQYFDIKKLGVPVMNTVLNGYMNLSQWKAVSNPLPQTRMLRMYRPEKFGWIDPIMVASEELDPETGTKVYKPVQSQIDWLVDRAEAQTNLSHEDESDKKVAILYYNHGAGKDNIGASYLEVIPSINNLLKGMANTSYNVESSNIPNKTELTELIVKQGTNIGNWAPGELQNLVETDKVELVPEDTYNSWFESLPETRKQEVIDRWGEPPGNIMVYEDDSGKRYLVIPKIKVSDDVILTPQPTRGWLQNNDALYHDEDLPPHHQYIAFYLWIQNEFDADVMINMGRHGTVEWLPGKEFGLFKDEWPALMNGNIPVVYPYVMDGMGEGMQAKRRGNAVIIDHLIPPVVRSGSYGNYSKLSEKITQYQTLELDPEMKKERYDEIVNMTYELHLDEQINMSLSQNNETKDEFLDQLGDKLRELRSTSMPHGLHVLGNSPQGNQLSDMVCSMLGDDYRKEVAQYNESEDAPYRLLDLVINQNMSITDAQEQVLGHGNTSGSISDDLDKGLEYSDLLSQSENEVNKVLDAMDGKHVSSKLGGDPVIRPEDTLPSGSNFYSSNAQLIPTKNAWELGKEMANQTLEKYRSKHGEYPKKLASVLWAGESTRHEGVMEAQILYLLGVKPVWDEDGEDVEDVELINSSKLDRPRIDVMIEISGLYRDTFPHKVELLDKAVYLAYHAPDNKYSNIKEEPRPRPEYIPYNPGNTTNLNYVRENTNEMFLELNESMKNETAAMTISLLRIFGPPDGAYGTGMANAVSASNTWENNTKLADLYMDRMNNVYGEQVWGESMNEIINQWQVENDSVENKDVFKDNLEDVGVTVHSRSSNTYGAMDTDDFYQYLGGLNLVVEQNSGKSPDSYIMNLQNPDAEQIETLSTYLSREITTRYLNPHWIGAMQNHGFEGAGQMGNFLENLWGWEALNPELVDNHVWDDVHDTYFSGSKTSEWIKETNPYEYQSMTGRMLETARKGNWDASNEEIKSLVNEYVKTVAETGDVTCCHHTCGNPSLEGYVEGYLSTPGVVDEQTAEKYREIMDEATTSSTNSADKDDTNSDDSLNSVQRGMVNSTSSATSNQTRKTDSDTGAGSDIDQNPGKKSESSDNYVEGYEMKDESKDTSEKSGKMSFSGSDIVGTLLVLLAVGAIIVGYKRRS